MTPKYYEFYLPILKVLSDLEKKDINTIIDEVVKKVGLTSEDMKETTRSGNQLRYRANISWAITDLVQGGFIERTERGVYMITIEGLELLEENPSKPTRETLASKSQKFKDFLNRQRPKQDEKKSSNDSETTIFLAPIKTSNSSSEFEVSSTNREESESVSLEELYHTLAILKKAKLSTEEIEDKIRQIEKTSIVRRNIEQLIGVIENLSRDINSNDTINIEFTPKKSISLKVGSYQESFPLSSFKSVKEPTKEDSIANSISEKKFISNPSAITSDGVSLPMPEIRKDEMDKKNLEAYEKPKLSKGVWIKPYSNKTFVLYGDFFPFTELLKSYGGSYSAKLSEGEGWVFMNGKREGLEKDLEPYIISPPKFNRPLFNNSKGITITAAQERKIIGSLSESQRELIMKYKTKMENLSSFSFLGITGPHKAVLLLSMFYLIKKKTIDTPKVYFTEELELQYNTYWQQLFGSSPSLGAAYPFAHLSKDSFLTHKLIRPLPDYNITWNRQILKKYIPYTMIEKSLFNLLRDSECNRVLGRFLITRYCDSQWEKSNEVISMQKSNTNEIGFQDYLNKALAKRGRVLSDSTITVYISALKSQYIKNKIGYIHRSGNVYDVEDLNLLNELALIVEEDVKYRRTSPTNRLALNLYIKYLSERYV